MKTFTRRELLAAFLGAPAALAACKRRGPTHFEGRVWGADDVHGHELRDGFSPAPTSRREVPVLVVGAGIAGLSAAWRLERAGFRDFEVVELDGAPGGTARSGENGFTRFPFGAHYLPCPLPHAKAVEALVLELGAATRGAGGRLEYDEAQLVRAPQERLFVGDRFYEGLFPRAGAGKADLAELARFEAEVATWAALVDGEGRRAFAVPMEHGSDDPEVAALDRLSFAQWLDRQGYRSARLRWWLEYGCRDDFGATLAQSSAWAGLHYHASRLEQGRSQEYLTWPEGNGRVVDHLARVAGKRLRTGVAALRARATPGGAEVVLYEPATGRCETVAARRAILAVPQRFAARLVADAPAQLQAGAAALDCGSWLVVNLTLSRRPRSRGFPECWDNVLFESRALGYVVATHQSDRLTDPRTVYTWYLPFTGDDLAAQRRQLLALSFEECVELALADLARPHPDLAECLVRADVWKHGHAIVRPKPGLFFGDAGRARLAAQRPLGPLHFAHTELSGLALLEEAQWHGVRAAEEVLAALGRPVTGASLAR